MPTIQDPELNQAIRRRFELVGRDPINFLAPEIVPVVLIDDLSIAPTTGWRGAITGSSINRVAGEVAAFQVFNPVGSGKLVRWDRVVLSDPDGISYYHLGRYNVDLDAALTQKFFRDTRSEGGPVAKVNATTDATPNLGNRIGIFRTQASSTNTFLDLDYILEPGEGLLIQLTDTNHILNCTAWWSERHLTQAEQAALGL